MNAAQVSLNPRSQVEIEPMIPEQLVSALVDGEVDVAQLDGLFAAENGEMDVLASWHTYQVIGDVLRGHGALATAHPPGDFLAGIRERLRSEQEPVVQPRNAEFPAVHTPTAVLKQVPAANDAVFRWKLVAGLASLAAVMAVSWTVMSGAPSGTGPQLAAAPGLPEIASAGGINAAASSTALVVNTGQGPLIRDARLEELLAEHRQNGGMSALQMPTGFIRNATYDAAGR